MSNKQLVILGIWLLLCLWYYAEYYDGNYTNLNIPTLQQGTD